VFTPYWRKARSKLEPRPPLPSPRRIESPEADSGLHIDALELLPKIRWDAAFAKTWQPGEAGATKALRRFRDHAVGDYPDARNIPGDSGTSRLSPHLHFGEISPMQIVWTLQEAARDVRSAKVHAGIESFIREIGWREFSHHLLYHFPKSTDENLNPNFDRFAWARPSPAQIQRWERGRTGFRSSMRACANSGPRAGCTTACACWSHRS
jgi:deoxyribodipyrimidine photo-lyase